MRAASDRVRILAAIEARRAARGPGKPPRLTKPPRLLPPINLEKSYRKSLGNILERAKGMVDAVILTALPRILREAQGRRPTADHARADEYSDEIERLMSLIRSGLYGQFSDKAIADLAAELARAIAIDNKRGIGAVFKSVLGVDLFASEPWLNSEVKAFVSSNVALIKTIPEQYLADVERMVYDGARRGQSYQGIADALQDKAYSKAASRAEVIARDQVGKFNGQLTELRQKSAGVTRYTWRTAQDERVRSEHAAREGKIFEWSDPPADGHPGEAIQCRCYAEPVLEDLIDNEE